MKNGECNVPASARRCGPILVLALAMSGVANADLPNDDCASALVVTDMMPAAEGDNSTASVTDDAEASCAFSDFDVWFEYVATCTGSVTVDTFGSDQPDTVLNVYDGCGGAEIACNDDTGGTFSQVSFAVTVGQSYWIRLASFALPGDYDLNISCASPLSNDDCASALRVTEGAPAAEGHNAPASEVDDAEASCQRSSDRDVWFEYVSSCTGGVAVDTFGSIQGDTVLSVYDGCGGTEIVCNDDTGGTLSQVMFDAMAEQSYWIRLASVATPGDYVLNISCGVFPANDVCASALIVTDGTPAAEGDNSQASTTDDAEASCYAFAGEDVWFEYVAMCTGNVTVDTFGSGQPDTVLSVYTACGGAEIACNDDTGGTLSELTFQATAEHSYWIRLASFGAPGDFDLNVSGPTDDGVPSECCRLTDCADLDMDSVRDDSCLWWVCESGTCVSTAVTFADIGGQAGACPPDGTADGHDNFHALNCFSNHNTAGVAPYPCEETTRLPLNADAGGPDGACCPDGFCDLCDVFHAMNAFAGENPCQCPANFVCPCPNPTFPPENPVLCPPGPMPESTGSVQTAIAGAHLRLAATGSTVRPGDTVEVIVLLDNTLPDIRGYQLHAAASGGEHGTLELVDIAIENRRDHVFAGLGDWRAFNVQTQQLLSGLDSPGVATNPESYLATLTFLASEDALGTFTVELLHDDTDPTHRTFFLPTPAGAKIEVVGAKPAVINVGSRRSRWIGR